MKRNNELVESVKTIVNNSNLSIEEKSQINSLVHAYKSATYENYEDRHRFYQLMVSDMVNDFGFDDDGLAKKMANEHRTIQQSFMRFVMKFIAKMAEHKLYDGRNERAVLTAKKIVDTLADNDMYLPCI